MAEPDAPLARLTGGIEGLPGRERRRLLAQGNDTALDVPDVPWTELFARQVSRAPGAVAVSGSGGSLTYGELDARPTGWHAVSPPSVPVRAFRSASSWSGAPIW
ncbi:hypothetical protein SCYAM73S_07351 [Streptomyces cyaneofuscatus]